MMLAIDFSEMSFIRFWYQGYIGFIHTMSWEMFSPVFSERICVNWYYFFLKCFMEFTGEAIWVGNLLCGKGFD